MSFDINQPRRIINKYHDVVIVTLTDKVMFAIVNSKHKLVTHKDGYLLLFHKAKDAKLWIDTPGNRANREWRIIKIKTQITKQ